MAKRYIVWTQLEVIDEDGEPATIEDSYVSVADFGSMEEAQTLQRKLHDQFAGWRFAPDPPLDS
jgi:hypothetical protein